MADDQHVPSKPDQGVEGPARFLGLVPWHPVLLAVHPALVLWAANANEVTSGEVWPALWVPTAAALGGWLAMWALLRAVHPAALAASALVTMGLYGARIPGVPSYQVVIALSIAAAAAVGLVFGRLRRDTLVGVTAMVNVLSLVLVAMTLPTIVSTTLQRASNEAPAAGQVVVPTDDPLALGRGDLPDIFYIIPDRYPREDTLRELFGYDNEPWLSALEARGFQVADQALANYPATGMSLASTWNLAPIDQLVETPENPKDWGPAYALLRDHALGRNLVNAGYEYIHMGTWWSPTSVVRSATKNLRLDGDSEFVSVFRDQVDPNRNEAEDDTRLEDLAWYDRSPLHTRFQWQELQRLAGEHHNDRARPRFVLAHITVPHEPYVFEPDGSPVPTEVARERTREDNFVRQVQYVNNQVDAFLDVLLSGPREDWPVVVIQSDEGPHPEGKRDDTYDWLEVTVEERREKLRILSAILLPEDSDLALPEDLVSVNTWRYLLDEILGTRLGPIDAPVYVYSPKAIYEFVDVTDQIRG